MDVASFDKQAKAAASYLSRKLNLFEIRLPAGDQPSINIDGPNGGTALKLSSQSWLSQGYDGVRIIGHESGTHLRCSSWDGITVIVGRHPGVVQMENLAVTAGYSRGFSVGQQNIAKVKEPKFMFRWYGGTLDVPPPAAGKGRTKWGMMFYNCDRHLAHLRIDATLASEHGSYGHGHSKVGQLNEFITFDGSGAENLKERPDATETAYTGANNWIIDRDITFKNWYQEWSDRGGAARVIQSAAAHYLAERCVGYGGAAVGSLHANQRGKIWMFSSEGSSYDIDTGKVDSATGFGNGYIMLRRCAGKGFSEFDWSNHVVRCARNGGPMMSAKGLLIDQCGFYGQRTIVQGSEMPTGRFIVKNCNSEAIRDWCGAHGFNTQYESTIPTSQRRIPLSEGFVR